MFGYGVGASPASCSRIMQVVAPGKHSTSHYALGTGIMQLGFILFSMMSGKIEALAFVITTFFIWCMLSAIPVLCHVADRAGSQARKKSCRAKRHRMP